jgi:hypothetical protein
MARQFRTDRFIKINNPHYSQLRAGSRQLLDAGIGLFEHELGKCLGPLFIAVLQFIVMYLLQRSLRITPLTKPG